MPTNTTGGTVTFSIPGPTPRYLLMRRNVDAVTVTPRPPQNPSTRNEARIRRWVVLELPLDYPIPSLSDRPRGDGSVRGPSMACPLFLRRGDRSSVFSPLNET